MCQLTFSDLGTLNKLYLTTQMYINASNNNHDGCGIFCNERVWKSELSAANIINLGECVNSIVTAQPTIAHVRFATNKTLVKQENSHPFTGKRIILAHNGRLEPKDAKKIDRTKVDSQQFLDDFEDYWLRIASKVSLPDALTEFMKTWEGKFAFMIYDPIDKQFYIVRGETAELHWTTVNDRVVVNTSKKELLSCLSLLSQHNQILHKSRLQFGDIQELDKNSIYKFSLPKRELIKVGEVKENKAWASSTYTSYGWENQNGVQVWTGHTVRDESNRGQSKAPKGDSSADYLVRFCNKSKLSIRDLNLICYITMGCNLVELDKDNYKVFKDTILETLLEEVKQEKVELWGKMLALNFPSSYYQKLEFPWMVNSYAELEKQHKIEIARTGAVQ